MLKEKIRLIKEELGEVDLKEEDVMKIKNKMASLDLPEHISKRLQEEIERYTLTNSTSPEVTTIRTYIDWLLSLPWSTYSKDNTDIKKIELLLIHHISVLKALKRELSNTLVLRKKLIPHLVPSYV